MSDSTLAAVLDAAAQPTTPARQNEPPPNAAPAITSADVDAARTEGHAAGLAEAQARNAEVIELCALAGQEPLTLGFIKDGKSVADVRTELLNARASQAGGEIDTRHERGAAPAVATVDLKADMQRRVGAA